MSSSSQIPAAAFLPLGTPTNTLAAACGSPVSAPASPTAMSSRRGSSALPAPPCEEAAERFAFVAFLGALADNAEAAHAAPSDENSTVLPAHDASEGSEQAVQDAPADAAQDIVQEEIAAPMQPDAIAEAERFLEMHPEDRVEDPDRMARFAAFLQNSEVVPQAEYMATERFVRWELRANRQQLGGGWEQVSPEWIYHPGADFCFYSPRSLFLILHTRTWWTYDEEAKNYRQVFLGTKERPSVSVLELAGILTVDPDTAATNAYYGRTGMFFAAVRLDEEGNTVSAAEDLAAPHTGPFGVRALFQGDMESIGKQLLQVGQQWKQTMTEVFVASKQGRDVLVEQEFMRRCDTSSCYALSKSTDRECAICFGGLNEHEQDEMCVRLDCKHMFHLECMRSWTHTCQSIPVNCPSCRSQVTSWTKVVEM